MVPYHYANGTYYRSTIDYIFLDMSTCPQLSTCRPVYLSSCQPVDLSTVNLSTFNISNHKPIYIYFHMFHSSTFYDSALFVCILYLSRSFHGNLCTIKIPIGTSSGKLQFCCYRYYLAKSVESGSLDPPAGEHGAPFVYWPDS